MVPQLGHGLQQLLAASSPILLLGESTNRHLSVGFEVLTAVIPKVESHFRGTCHLHLKGLHATCFNTVPNVMSIFLSLGRLFKESIGVRGPF
jgi:hypothetical protein